MSAAIVITILAGSFMGMTAAQIPALIIRKLSPDSILADDDNYRKVVYRVRALFGIILLICLVLVGIMFIQDHS